MMYKVTVIMTCHNRKDMTCTCINSLVNNNDSVDFSFIIVDDGSSDDTAEAVKSLGFPNITVLFGDGNLYWSGGMRLGIGYYLDNRKTDYVLLVNDDVEFFDYAVDKMAVQAIEKNSVIVGATCDDNGQPTYGAKKLRKHIFWRLYDSVKSEDGAIQCDFFCANCVLLSDEVLSAVGNISSVYRHSGGDYDYGLRISRMGYSIISSAEYVGICRKNSDIGTWRDKSLSRLERLKRKESIKGAPFRPWFYFIWKNFGLILAIRYSITPYIRIIFGK